MPESVFGIGRYACYDADYLRLNITDAPDKIGGLLEADGWTVDEYWAYDNYYAWTEDAICFDYQIYTAEEIETSGVYPKWAREYLHLHQSMGFWAIAR